MKTLSVREKSKTGEKFSSGQLSPYLAGNDLSPKQRQPSPGLPRPGKGCGKSGSVYAVGHQFSANTTLTELAEKSVSPRTMSVILATSAPDSSPLSVETTTLTLLSPIKATHSG